MTIVLEEQIQNKGKTQRGEINRDFPLRSVNKDIRRTELIYEQYLKNLYGNQWSGCDITKSLNVIFRNNGAVNKR